MANPQGYNQYKSKSGARASFKAQFGRNPKKGESGYTAKTVGPKAAAFKKQFGRLPKPGEKSYGK